MTEQRAPSHIPSQGGMRLKQGLKNLVALAVGCSVALVVIELVVRAVMPQLPSAEWFAPSDRYHHVLKPDFHQRFAYAGHDFVMDVQTNAHGFRDKPHDFGAPFDGTTILLLGDSFVFGYGINVEDRFDTWLAKQYEGNDVRLVNAGVPGWGTSHETRFARDNLQAIRPDIIVLLYCGNDPANDRGEQLPVLPQDAGWTEGIKAILRQYSHAYRFVMWSTATWRHPSLAETPPAAQTRNTDLEPSADLCPTLRTIRTFATDYHAINPDGLLVIAAVDPTDTQVATQLATLDNGNNLRYLDFSKQFEAIPPAQRVQPWDAHWSPSVHEAFGEALLAFRPINRATER